MIAMAVVCVFLECACAVVVFMDLIVSTNVAKMIAPAMDTVSKADASARLVSLVQSAQCLLMRAP